MLEKNIQASPEEIQKLDKKIREAVTSLTNIEPIIAETKDDLEKVNKLKDDAMNARYIIFKSCSQQN